MNSNWEKEFFTDIALDFWRDAVPQQMTETDIDFIDRTLSVAQGSRLLDVPCGNGRHARGLTGRGYHITGIDQSEEEIARLREAGVTGEWRIGDIRDLPELPAFDGGYCFGNSFAYLDAANGRRFLRGVARLMKPGARFIVETGTAAESILPNLTTNRWIEAGGVTMLSSARYDVRASRLDIDYTFIRGAFRQTRPSSSYVHTVAEICRMCEEAGLEVSALYGSTAGAPFTLGSRLILVAEARGAG